MKQKKTPKATLPKGVPQEFIDGLDAQTTDQLKATIVRLQVQNQENEAFKESDEFIAAQTEFDMAKDSYMLVAGPVKETTVSLRNKTKLVIERLRERGGC